MVEQEGIKKFFKIEEITNFDFLQVPILIRKIKNKSNTGLFKKDNVSQWKKTQSHLMRWTKKSSVFTKEFIEEGKILFDTFFKMRKFLKGNILDIGGGWGLFRQWWEAGENHIFIVHDPGIERFLAGPHKLHPVCYERAFSLPMVFIDGFGEKLPYKNDIFDTCLIAATLDHCINSYKVISEGYRCLKPQGNICIFQTCVSLQPDGNTPNTLKISLKNLLVRLSLFYKQLFYTEVYMRHSTIDDLTQLLEKVGFKQITITTVSEKNNFYAFEAKK